jgi:hypothetical protein
MPKYLVVRSWVVDAVSAVEAVELAQPGEHQDVRAMLVFKSYPAIRLTFATSGVVQGFEDE